MSVRLILLLLAAVLLLGCATPEPQIVKVPVPVPCTVDVGPEPDAIATYAALKAQPDIRERLKLALEQIIQDAARLGQYRAAVSAC